MTFQKLLTYAGYLLFYLLLFLGVQVVAFAGLAIALKIAGRHESLETILQTPEGMVQFAIALGVGELAFSVFYLLVRRVKREEWRNCFTRNNSFLLLIAALLSMHGLSLVVTALGVSDGGMGQMFQGMSGNVLAIVMIALIGPLCEELIFRHGIQRTLIRHGMRPMTAIVLTALSFGIVHGNWAQGIVATAAGIILGWIYEKSRGLSLPVLLHIVNNSIGVALYYFFPEDADKVMPTTEKLMYGGGGIVLTAVGLLVLLRIGRTTPPLETTLTQDETEQ